MIYYYYYHFINYYCGIVGTRNTAQTLLFLSTFMRVWVYACVKGGTRSAQSLWNFCFVEAIHALGSLSFRRTRVSGRECGMHVSNMHSTLPP